MPGAVLPNPQNIASAQTDARSAYYAQTGLQEHERRLFACYLPAGTDSSDPGEPLPTILEILPTPRITERSLEIATQSQSGGMEAVQLQKFFVEGVSRTFIDADIRPAYWLVLDASAFDEGTGPVATDVQAKKYPRYTVMSGSSPTARQNEYQISLVEKRG
jgi:hypothetical protein